MKISDTTISYKKISKSFNSCKKHPFKGVLDLSVLIDAWENFINDSPIISDTFKKEIFENIQFTQELNGPIEDLSLLEKHRDVVDMLFSIVFPAGSKEYEISAAIIPFSTNMVYETPKFKTLISKNGKIDASNTKVDIDLVALEYVKILRAYTFIGKKFYNLDVKFDYPLIVSFKDPETSMDLYYKIEFNTQFMNIVCNGEIPKLKAADKKRLLSNLADLKTWTDILPPHLFEFHGFGIVKLIDVTDQEVISDLKRDLIENESILSETQFVHIQNKLRVLLRLPKLYLGLVAFQNDDAILLNSGYNLENNVNDDIKFRYKHSDFANTIYDCTNIEQTEIRVIENIRNLDHLSFIEEKLLDFGLHSAVVAPLFYQGELIGGLEISSPEPGDLNELNSMKINAVLPLFSIAVQQTLEELNHKVQGIIKEKFTFIHPTVEWRFQEAALELMEKQQKDPTAAIDDIVFENVVPLYSVSDIRSSTLNRNQAIKSDLIHQLSLARNCLEHANTFKSLPLFEQLIFRIKKKMGSLSKELRSEDENMILDFLDRDVEPVFDYIQNLDPSLAHYVTSYHNELDPKFGIVYHHRKAYDDSVHKISDAISCYLESQEIVAQEMCPHFFEKHKTDGVDFSLYIGKSLVSNGLFSPICLKNLRLWQLIVMCGIVQKVEEIKSSLPLPLETAHLILIQNTPLSIRFRSDERQFDVDGSYNVRYEIMKKRIDKSVVKSTNERLTQPGKIALIYSNPKEILEYKDFIEYLQSRGFLDSQLEELELEDLQGIRGLKALRVTVKTTKKAIKSHDELVREFPVLN